MNFSSIQLLLQASDNCTGEHNVANGAKTDYQYFSDT
jgi:hypothetical protein